MDAPDYSALFNLDDVALDELGPVLAAQFNMIDRAFVGADEGDKAHGYLLCVVQALRAFSRLPGFSSEMIAMGDLKERLDRLTVGQKKPLMDIIDAIKPDGHGRAPDSLSEQIGQARAVAIVQFLVSRDWGEKQACKLLADELARVGVKGRQGGPITPHAVSAWIGKIKSSDPMFRLTLTILNEHAAPDFGRHRPDVVRVVRMLIERGPGVLR